jgi:hypothetical protein
MLILAGGVAVYVLARPSIALFLPDFAHFGLMNLGGSTLVGGWIPSFAHVLGFALLTAAVTGHGRRSAVMAPAFWALINIAFEVGQHPSVAPQLDSWLSPLERYGALAAAVPHYFRYGTFDVADLLAALSAAVVAYVIILRLTREASCEYS